MMRTFLLIALAACSILSYAQKNPLPEAVQKSFDEKYPSATEVKHKTKKDEVRIRFQHESNACLAVFSTQGEWQQSQTTLKHKNAPAKVAATIEKKYPEGGYSNVLFIETKTGEKYYKVSVDTPNAVVNLELDENGKITKTEKMAKPKEQKSNTTDSE